MNWLRALVRRLGTLLRRERFDADLEEEMRLRRELREREQIERGLSPEEAHFAMCRRFGNDLALREESRDMWGWSGLEDTWQDVRYGLRMLAKNPGFTTVAVLTLALGIGANIAVFSVVNTILLRPLPFRDPQQLVRILSKDTASGESGMTYSSDATEEFQQRNRSFQEVSGYFAFTGPDNLRLIGKGQPRPVTGLMVGKNFFHTLGVEPSLGRLFTADECVHNGRPVALLSHAFWERQFAGNPGIVGQAVDLNGSPVTVIGVLPETFDFGSVFSPGAKIDLYTPAILDDMRDWGNIMALVGRLKPGVTLAQAQAEADLLFPHLEFNAKHPEWGGDYTGRLLGLKDYVSGKLRRSLIVLWFAVGMILLIVCVNLSNLLLARAAARSREFAMRSALGAGRGRLVRQLLTESLILSGAGAVLGLGFAFAVTRYLAHQGSIALPLLSTVRIDGAALGWTMLIAVTAAVFFGLAPGLRISGGNLQEALKDSGYSMSAGRKHERMRAALVVSEVALAFVLLVGAGLLLRSFLCILDVDLGFQPSGAAAISVDYDDGNDAAKRGAIWQDIIRRVEAIPGVETAGISDYIPMSTNRAWGISAKGKEYRQGELPGTFVYNVSPGYLRAMGMHLVSGRDISWEDGPTSEKVVIINETIARRLWPGENPIGRIARVNGSDTQVIGVVADVHESSVEGKAGWQMYLPATQWGPAGAQLVVRTKLPPETLASSVMSTLRQINPGQPATEFRPIQRVVDHAVSPRRFFVSLVTCFAVLGLLLAALGIYGVISYSVAQRTQEIGIRMALGATASQVQFGVIAKTLRLALLGVALGTIGSLAAAKWIASLLYGTTPTDPATFVGIILILSAVGFIAGYIPARRATKVDPLVALRYE
jgi:predicted permease